jgi:pilus assembly protein Flp/PilA
MKVLLRRIWRDESGQDLTDYALILLLLSLVCIAAMRSIAQSIQGAFTTTATNLATT